MVCVDVLDGLSVPALNSLHVLLSCAQPSQPPTYARALHITLAAL